MRVLLEAEVPITERELRAIMDRLEAEVAGMGMRPPDLEQLVVFGDETPYVRRGFREVGEGVLIGDYSLCVRGGVPANVFIDELVTGYLALAYLSNFYTLDLERVRRLGERVFMRVLAALRDA